MKRKIISTIFTLIGISVVGFLFLLFIGLFKEQDSGILIESDPASKIFIDGVEVGTTPYESNIKPGDLILKMVPNEIEGIVFDDYETKINLVPGIRTIVKRVFDKNEEYSSGVVVSFEKIGGKESYVTIVSMPDGAQISIDDKNYGYTPIRINVPAGDHSLSISMDGYVGKTLPIKVYSGFKLTASVKLAKSKEAELPNKINVPTNDTNFGKLKINSNSAGFLMVRSGANTGFPEIGQVNSGDIYDILEEGEHGQWYKINFLDSESNTNIDGWVNAKFVTKL